MKLVIDIPDEMYMDIKEEVRTKVNTFEHIPFLHEVISVGTLLPKGHGDLIDRSEVIKSLFDYHKGQKTIGQCIDDVQTIIEADEESEGIWR